MIQFLLFAQVLQPTLLQFQYSQIYYKAFKFVFKIYIASGHFLLEIVTNLTIVIIFIRLNQR